MVADGSKIIREDRALRRSIVIVWAFSILLILALAVAVFAQTRFERREAIETGVRQNINRVIAFQQYVTRTIEAADAVTLHLADRYSTAQDVPALLSGPAVERKLIRSVSLFDANGDLLGSTLASMQSANIADRNGFRVHALRQIEGLYVGKPIRSQSAGGVFIGMSRRVETQDGRFAGVAIVQVAPGQFTDFYETANVRPFDLMSVIGLDGITRARRTGSVSSYGEDLTGMRVMKEQMARPNGTYLGPSALDGVERYFSHRRLADYPLFVTIGVARADLIATAGARAANYIAGAAVVSLLILAFAFTLANGMRRRRTAAIALHDANVRLREAQRVGRIGDWKLDLASGRMEWSRQLFDVYGRNPALGAPTYDEALAALDKQSRAAIGTAIARATETGEPQDYEVCTLGAGGERIYVHTVAVPSRDASGRVAGLYGTAQDVTARKQVEVLRAEIAHLSRIDAMNTMAATLAHELNQPLAAATNYLSGIRRLAQRHKDPELSSLREGVANADRQVQMAAQIIRRIRDMVAKKAVTYEPASLSAIVDDSLALIAVAANYPKVALTRDLDPEADQIIADRIQIQQVLINLVRNACEATRKLKAPEVRISSKAQADGVVRLTVSDNGPGIPESLGDLFSPFESSTQGGLGLGLSISRTIVEANGGRIWLGRSESGTVIHFTIPAVAAESGSAADAAPPRKVRSA